MNRTVFFTRQQSLTGRGIAIFFVVVSHYAIWCADIVTSEPLQYALSRLGVYGVCIFFLLSGYGLVKSGQRQGTGIHYWKGRLQNTYIPYLLIAGVIEVYAGGDWTLRRLYKLLTGYEFWFIRNILIFYVAFFVIFRLAKKDWMRLALLSVAVFAYCGWLAHLDRASFWVVSNPAFVIGAALALYEKKLLRVADRCYPLWLVLFSGCMVWVVKSGMDIRFTPVENCDKIRPGMAAAVMWTLFCIQLTPLLPKTLKALQFFGALSLELYLLHTFLYNLIVNALNGVNRWLQLLLVIAVTVFMAWLVHFLLERLWKHLRRREIEKQDGRKAYGGRAV